MCDVSEGHEDNTMTGRHISTLNLWTTLEEHNGGGAWGFVQEYQGIAKVIKEYEKLTVSQYIIDYNTIMYKTRKDMDVFHKKIRFDDFGDNKIPNDGTPFIIGGSIRYSCQRGNDRHAYSKSKYKSTREELAKENPDGVRMYKKRKEGSKVGCASRIYIKKVMLFPEHKITELTSYKRMKITRAIKKSVSNGDHKGMIIRYYIKLPNNDSHTNHELAQDCYIKRLDKRLMDEIRKLVRRNVQSATTIRTHLEQFVEKKIQPLPSKTDAAYYPSLTIVRGHMNRAQRTMKLSMYDPECVELLMTNWKIHNPDDNYYFRSNSIEGSTDENDTFLLVYQSKYQRHLLQRYGQAVILDPIHRVIKYGLCLFFLEVKTNAGFAVIASFVCQSESASVITEAMQRVRDWNPVWIPQHFMTDVAEADTQGLEMVFPGCSMLYSDYHRELAWDSWLKNKANGVTDRTDLILDHLHKIAASTSEQQFHALVANLNQTPVWQESPKLQKWFSSQWLVVHMNWVWYFRKHCGLMINTSDVEKLGRTFKAKYLKHKWCMSVSSMTQQLMTMFIPKQIRRYVTENRVPLSGKYNQPVIPDFLQNRPNGFVISCLTNITQAERMQYTDVFAMDFTTNTYKVQSTTNPYMTYTVTIDPFECECLEWQRTYIPCKHLFSVLLYTPFSWQHISCKYKESCYTTIDYDILVSANKDTSLNQTLADIEDDNIVMECDSAEYPVDLLNDNDSEDNDNDTVIMDESDFIPDHVSPDDTLTSVRDVLRECSELTLTCSASDVEDCEDLRKIAEKLLTTGKQLKKKLEERTGNHTQENADTGQFQTPVKRKKPGKQLKTQTPKHQLLSTIPKSEEQTSKAQNSSVEKTTVEKPTVEKTIVEKPTVPHNNDTPPKVAQTSNKTVPTDQCLMEYPWEWDSLMH